MYSCIYSFIDCSFIYSFIHLSIYLSDLFIRSIYQYIYIYLFVYLFICLFVCLFICLFVYLFICLFVYLSICLFVCMYVCMYVCMCDGRMYVCMSHHITCSDTCAAKAHSHHSKRCSVEGPRTSSVGHPRRYQEFYLQQFTSEHLIFSMHRNELEQRFQKFPIENRINYQDISGCMASV